jgi:hypothetical protein
LPFHQAQQRIAYLWDDLVKKMVQEQEDYTDDSAEEDE